MKRTLVCKIILIMLQVGTFTLAFSVQSVEGSGTIYIRPDGSLDPSTAPIQRDGNVYTLTGSITITTSFAHGIVVERDGIVLDGAGYTLEGTGETHGTEGVRVRDRSNVIIKNVNIELFWAGIFPYNCSDVTISGNKMTNNVDGIYVSHSDYREPSITTIIGNNITNNDSHGIYLYASPETTIIDNNIIDNHQYGIAVDVSPDNTISGNNIIDNGMCGIWLLESSNNMFYHNMLTSNTKQVYDVSWDNPAYLPSINTWDDDYPSGGNYWNDYSDIDIYSGPSQDEPGSDGIWDNPYDIDSNNIDRYPFTPPTFTLTIHSAVGGTTTPPAGSYTYYENDVVMVTATSDINYYFDHWDYNGHTRANNPISITMDQDYSLTPVFIHSGPSVPEFPIGLTLEILFVPVIIYMLWRSKRDPRMPAHTVE